MLMRHSCDRALKDERQRKQTRNDKTEHTERKFNRKKTVDHFINGLPYIVYIEDTICCRLSFPQN